MMPVIARVAPARVRIVRLSMRRPRARGRTFAAEATGACAGPLTGAPARAAIVSRRDHLSLTREPRAVFIRMRTLVLAAAIAAAPSAAQGVRDAAGIVATRHTVTVRGRTLRYTARAGTIPIRDNETGSVHGRIFFIAYTLDRSAGAPARP